MKLISSVVVAQMAPDAATLKGGRLFANPNKWSEKHCSDEAWWGMAPGSGKELVKTQISRKTLITHCTCGARATPCKHALGLLFLFALNPDVFLKSVEMPEWVRARQGVGPDAENQTGPESDKRLQDKTKRADERMLLVSAGATELELQLRDLLRAGFLTIPEKGNTFFDAMARRMVDSKAPGLANWIRKFEAMDYSNDSNWHSGALENAAKIWMILDGLLHYDQLTDMEQENIKTQIGWTRNRSELLEDTRLESIQDKWLVLGSLTEPLEDALNMQRTWLYGTSSRRFAVLTEYALLKAPFATNLALGSFYEARLVFYPGTLPERALITESGAVSAQGAATFPTFQDWSTAHRDLSAKWSMSPWADDVPQVVGGLTLVLDRKNWYLKDIHGLAVPLEPTFETKWMWRLLAYFGGKPMVLVILRKADRLLPLGMVLDAGYRPFENVRRKTETGNPAEIEPGRMKHWNNLIRISLLGTERMQVDPDELPMPLQSLLARAVTRNPESLFFKTAALTWMYEKAGTMPDEAPPVDHGLAPDESLEYCPLRFEHLWKKILVNHAAVLPLHEFFYRKLAGNHWLVRPHLLSEVLMTGAIPAFRPLQPLIRQITGLRGQWMAQFNPAWKYLTELQEETVMQVPSGNQSVIEEQALKEPYSTLVAFVFGKLCVQGWVWSAGLSRYLLDTLLFKTEQGIPPSDHSKIMYFGMHLHPAVLTDLRKWADQDHRNWLQKSLVQKTARPLLDIMETKRAIELEFGAPEN
jgi:hypothetical protein